MKPILLDSTAGCPGVRDPIKGRAAAICHVCTRFGEPSPHIEPQAKRLSGGEWFCPERRSSGAHEPDCAPASGGGKSCEVGGTPGGFVSGVSGE